MMRTYMNLIESVLDKPTLSASELADKYGVSLTEINKKIKQGAEIEKEHTTHESVAEEIARDHLGEKLDYYDLLKKVEDDE